MTRLMGMLVVTRLGRQRRKLDVCFSSSVAAPVASVCLDAACVST